MNKKELIDKVREEIEYLPNVKTIKLDVKSDYFLQVTLVSKTDTLEHVTHIEFEYIQNQIEPKMTLHNTIKCHLSHPKTKIDNAIEGVSFVKNTSLVGLRDENTRLDLEKNNIDYVEHYIIIFNKVKIESIVGKTVETLDELTKKSFCYNLERLYRN